MINQVLLIEAYQSEIHRLREENTRLRKLYINERDKSDLDKLLDNAQKVVNDFEEHVYSLEKKIEDQQIEIEVLRECGGRKWT